MEYNNINFNQIDFGRLEPNSLYAIKFPHYWQLSTISSMIQKLNKTGEEYGVKFIPFLYDMEIANGKKMNNFIEISATNSLQRNVIINLNNVTSIIRYTPTNKEEYWINLVGDESYRIDKEQYEAIKAKLIDNGSKE